jgi:hypothetical protein
MIEAPGSSTLKCVEQIQTNSKQMDRMKQVFAVHEGGIKNEVVQRNS